jgi:hypothetical protein
MKPLERPLLSWHRRHDILLLCLTEFPSEGNALAGVMLAINCAAMPSSRSYGVPPSYLIPGLAQVKG